jgi:hypothetical protein
LLICSLAAKQSKHTTHLPLMSLCRVGFCCLCSHSSTASPDSYAKHLQTCPEYGRRLGTQPLNVLRSSGESPRHLPTIYVCHSVTPYDGVCIERRGILLQTGTSMSCACAGQTQGRVWGLCSVLQVYSGSPVPERGELSRVPLAYFGCSTKDARWCVPATLVTLLSLWSDGHHAQVHARDC